jgi:Ca2+/Na+ antiporter
MRELLGVLGLQYTPEDFNKKFKEADKDNSNYLDLGEFLEFFYDMITGEDQLPYQKDDKKAASKPEEKGGDDDDEEDEMPDEFRDLPPEEQKKQIMTQSFKSMIIGTVLVLIFSDPMVDVLTQIGAVTGVPSFYVAFVLAPLASNASELVSSMKLAARKTQTSITQSLQTLEGAACMNNTFCLSIFFFLIYYQGLAWKFTAETMSIFFVQVLVFVIVKKSQIQTMKDGMVIFACYPLSLVFVAILEAVGLD